jgi:hypothetical protein
VEQLGCTGKEQLIQNRGVEVTGNSEIPPTGEAVNKLKRKEILASVAERTQLKDFVDSSHEEDKTQNFPSEKYRPTSVSAVLHLR